MDLMGEMINKTCIKRLQVDHMGYIQLYVFHINLYSLAMGSRLKMDNILENILRKKKPCGEIITKSVRGL